MGHFIAHFISVQIKGQKYGQRLERAIAFNSQKKTKLLNRLFIIQKQPIVTLVNCLVADVMSLIKKYLRNLPNRLNIGNRFCCDDRFKED